jgi:hypothetical protein
MKYYTPLFRRPNVRALAASLIVYLMLAAPLAPLAAPRNVGANAPAAPDATLPDVPTLPDAALKAAPAPVPAPLAAASLSVTKADAFTDVGSDGLADPGQTVTYTVTITNNGPDDAANVTLTDTVDSNSTLQAATVMSSPIGFDDEYNVIGNVGIDPTAAEGLLANDTDPDNPSNSNANLTVSAIGTDNSAPFSFTTANGGLVESSTTDGAFTYTPGPGFSGDDTFTYTTSDNTGKTNTATVTLTVSAVAIWFVDDSADPNGNGTLAKPFNCYTGTTVPATGPTCFSDSAADDPGDVIFLFDGTYTGGYTLLNNQRLLGQGMSATLASAAGVTPEPYTITLPAPGNNPSNVTLTTTLPATNAVNLASGNNNTLRGFTGGNTTGADIAAPAFGTLTVSEVALNGNGQALNLDSGALNATFVSISSNTSAGQGINLDQVTGTLTSTGGTTVTDPTTQCVLVTGSTADINFGTTSCTLATDGISLQNNSAGTRTFGTTTVTGATGVGFLHALGGGATTVGTTTISNPGGVGIDIDGSNASLSFGTTTVTKNATSGIGVDLTNNATHTIGFTTLNVTTTNAFALNANNSGTVNAGGGSLTQNGAGGGAASLTNTALGLTFTSVSSDGGGNGLIFSGGSGTFTSSTTNLQNNTGVGLLMTSAPAVAASFGNTTVNSSAGDAVDLSGNTANVTFAALNLTPDSGLRGLDALNVTGTITSTSGTITTSGSATANAVFIDGPAARTPLNLVLTSISTNGAPVAGITDASGTAFTSGTTSSQNSTTTGITVSNSTTTAINFGTTTVSSSAGIGVSLSSNSAAIAFADLDITPDSGQRALHATSNTGQLTSTSGTVSTSGNTTAVEIVGTSSANRTPLNLTFTSVTPAGTLTAAGIILTNTSANSGAAGFSITGTGSTDGSGGAITNTAAGVDAIALTDAQRVVIKNFNIGDAAAANNEQPTAQVVVGGDGISSTRVTQGTGGTYGLDLDNVKIADTGAHGINGEGGGNVGMRFINGEIINPGDDSAVPESSIWYGSGFPTTDQITGTVTITSSTFSGFHGYGFSAENAGNGTLNMTVTSCTFQNNDSTSVGDSGIQLIADGSSGGAPTANLHVLNTNFTNIDLDGVEVIIDPGGVGNVTIDGGTTNSPNGDNAFHLVSGSQDGDDVESSTNLIQNVTVNAMRGSIIFLKSGAGTYHATVQNSTLDSGDTDTGGGAHLGRGVEVLFDADDVAGETINARVRVHNVIFNKIGVDGVHVGANEIVPGSQAHITVTNCTIGTAAEPVGMQDTGEGIEVIATDMTMNIKAESNSIVSRGQTTTSEGIDIDAEAGSTVNATVLSNTISGALSPNANSFDANTEVAGTTMCLDLRTNNASGGLGNNYQLAAAAGSTFNFEFPGAGAISAAEIQGAQTAGTAAINSGTVNKNGGANCTEPTLPNTPTLPSSPLISSASELKTEQQLDYAQPVVVTTGVPASDRTATGEKQAESLMGGGVTSRPFVGLPARPQAKRNAGAPRMRHTAEDSALRIEGAGETRQQAAQKKPRWGTPQTHDVPTTNAPTIMGNNITWNIGTLPAGKSVTITFDVVIEDPFSAPQPQISNQATVTADGGINVLSDDTSVVGANDPTVTPVNVPPTIFIRDAEGSEPGELIFTVTLSAPAPSGGVSVDFTTNDGTATVADGDYTTTTGTISFTSGQQVQSIAVPILSNPPDNESPETITVTLSNPVGGVINPAPGGDTATGTITEDAAPGTAIISELRTSGPGGLGDDFVEIANHTGSPMTVAASDSSAGWGLFKMGADCDATPVLVGTIPNGEIIPPRGHYLFVGSQYSLANYGGTGAAAGNLTLSSDLESDANVALFDTSDVANISTATRLDAVGFGLNNQGNCKLLREGSNAGPASGSTLEHTYFRKPCQTTAECQGSPTGTPKDTGDNLTDFVFADTLGTEIVGTGKRLGAPGPENIGSPRRKELTEINSVVLDGGQSPASPPNRVRDFTSVPANNETFGTMTIRRRIINNTGGQVTRLRFRITDMTTFPASGTADLRALTSADSLNVMITGDAGTCGGPPPCTVTVQGTTLEQPPSQPEGGGLNSTLTVTLGTPIPNGGSVNVQFRLGVEMSGTFKFFVVTEALP